MEEPSRKPYPMPTLQNINLEHITQRTSLSLYKRGETMRILNFDLIRNMPRPATRAAMKINKDIIACEVGVWYGKNAKNIYDHLNIKKLYLVDPYIPYNDEKTIYGIMKAKQSAIRRLRDCDRVEWIFEDSNKVIDEEMIKENLDFVYLDGFHDYETVKKECEYFWSKINKGGVLSGNDIDASPVTKAVWEFSNKINQVPQILKQDWIFIK